MSDEDSESKYFFLDVFRILFAYSIVFLFDNIILVWFSIFTYYVSDGKLSPLNLAK
jgi:hypothetical protein